MPVVRRFYNMFCLLFIIETHLLVDTVEVNVFPHGLQQGACCLTGSVSSLPDQQKWKLSLWNTQKYTHKKKRKSLFSSHWPIVVAAAGADTDDFGEAALVDDGSGVLPVALAQIVQDLAEAHCHLHRQLGVEATVVVVIIFFMQHVNQLGQHLFHFKRQGHTHTQ